MRKRQLFMSTSRAWRMIVSFSYWPNGSTWQDRGKYKRGRINYRKDKLEIQIISTIIPNTLRYRHLMSPWWWANKLSGTELSRSSANFDPNDHTVQVYLLLSQLMDSIWVLHYKRVVLIYNIYQILQAPCHSFLLCCHANDRRSPKR